MVCYAILCYGMVWKFGMLRDFNAKLWDLYDMLCYG